MQRPWGNCARNIYRIGRGSMRKRAVEKNGKLGHRDIEKTVTYVKGLILRLLALAVSDMRNHWKTEVFTNVVGSWGQMRRGDFSVELTLRREDARESRE